MTILVTQRKHQVKFIVSAAVLLLLQLDFISALHQIPITSIADVFTRQPTASPQQLTCLWSASVADVVEETSSDQSQELVNYDWDEQFEQLQLFMSEYGHCNFPQNPSKQLNKKFPMLTRFCHDQRVEYKLLQKRKHKGRQKMTLAVFDRAICCRRLEELGFEFSLAVAPWYDRYHELIQYSTENGCIRVPRDGDNKNGLAEWVYNQRCRRNELEGYSRLSDSQINLLDDIGFKWKSEVYDELWNAMYNELVAFRNEHGHFIMEFDDPLYLWITHQRGRRAKKKGTAALTDEQIRLLDEIGFPWKPERYDAKWYAMYEELKRFRKKYGHCQPTQSTNKKLDHWTLYQQNKRRKGDLSIDKIKLLDKLGFPWERNRSQFTKMLKELTEYFHRNGHIHVSQDDDPDLYEWMATQRERYHGTAEPAMSDEQIEKLEELRFCWSLDWRDRTWHEKLAEAVEFFKEHGHVVVNEKENPSLYNWIETQEKRYKEAEGQKPLSAEELELLEQIDFPFFDGQPRMTWKSMYAKVERFREGNDGRFPTSHKDDTDLNRWLRQQRHRLRFAFGYTPLSAEQKSLLESINFPSYLQGKDLRAWYKKYDELVDFQYQHGHFLVDKNKDAALRGWIHRQRIRYKGTGVWPPLSKLQLYLLERIDFTWASDRNEIEWQQNYDEVAEFLEVRGHIPRRSENRRLYRWIWTQRMRCKPDMSHTYDPLLEHQIQQLEKIGVVIK